MARSRYCQLKLIANQNDVSYTSILGDKDYLFGDSPSSYDAGLFGFVVATCQTGLPTTRVCLTRRAPPEPSRA